MRKSGTGIQRELCEKRRYAELLTQLSYRYASDSRNAPENCGLLRPLSICGAKNHCPFRGHLALTGSTLMCWRRCSRNAVRTVGRRKSRLDHRFSLGALQSELPPPWHVWCLNRSAPHNALISSHIFSSGGKVGPKFCESQSAHGISRFRRRKTRVRKPLFCEDFCEAAARHEITSQPPGRNFVTRFGGRSATIRLMLLFCSSQPHRPHSSERSLARSPPHRLRYGSCVSSVANGISAVPERDNYRAN